MHEHNRFTKLDALILGGILALAVMTRSYNLTAPLSDFHSWRQADTAAVARNFVRDGFNLMQPHYDDLSSIQSGLPNPTGLRYVEYPLYNATFALLYKIAPVVPVEVWGRIVTVICSLVVIALVYYFGRSEVGRLAGAVAAFVYAVFPAFVFFSRVVLPETPALMLALLSVFFLHRYMLTKKPSVRTYVLLVLSCVMFALALLVKPPIIFYGIALAFLFMRKHKFALVGKPEFYLYFVLAGIPLIAWRMFIQSHPEAIPASGWLITSVNTFEGAKEIFFRPAFFRWIFYERINLMIFGGFLTVFFFMGTMSRLKSLFLHSLLASAFAYVFVFQGGNVQHEYYQTIIFPALTLFTGVGVSLVYHNRRIYFHPILTGALILFMFVLSFYMSYYYKVKDFYTYPEDLTLMARIIDTFTRPEDRIVADRMGDTTLLYLSDRKGSPMYYGDAETLVRDGYSYVLTDRKEIITELKSNDKHRILFENDQFTLFRL